MALYFDLRYRHKASPTSITPEAFDKQLNEAIDNIATVMTGVWQDRFCEIEWPTMIWLNWMVGFGKHVRGIDFWPEKKVQRVFEVEGLAFGM